MRISDWSSDVCSSDLVAVLDRVEHAALETQHRLRVRIVVEQRDQEIAAKGQRARLRIGNEAELFDRLFDRRARLVGQEFGPVDHPAHGLFRSEEHTSELQSLMRISYAVFCLKKKRKKNTK